MLTIIYLLLLRNDHYFNTTFLGKSSIKLSQRDKKIQFFKTRLTGFF